MFTEAESCGPHPDILFQNLHFRVILFLRLGLQIPLLRQLFNLNIHYGFCISLYLVQAAHSG